MGVFFLRITDNEDEAKRTGLGSQTRIVKENLINRT
jgi:hypothetical protein